MVRIILGVIAGFFVWVILWFGIETILSVVWPEFGAHQAAFQAAIEDGAPFTSNSAMLTIHVVVAAVVSFVAGALAAAASGGNRRVPAALGILLLGMGLLKASMSWQLVPAWYNIAFIAVLVPMALLGGRTKAERG